MSKPTKHCLNCKQTILNTRKQVYCTDACKKQYYDIVYTKKRTVLTKTCAICNKEYQTTRALYKNCSKQCAKEYSKIQTKKHYQKLIPYKMTYGQVHDWTVFRRDNFQCIYCGKTSIEDGIKLALDHIIPRSKGGEHTYMNIVTSCQKCNGSKHAILDNTIVERVLKIVAARNVKFIDILKDDGKPPILEENTAMGS